MMILMKMSLDEPTQSSQMLRKFDIESDMKLFLKKTILKQ